MQGRTRFEGYSHRSVSKTMRLGGKKRTIRSMAHVTLSESSSVDTPVIKGNPKVGATTDQNTDWIRIGSMLGQEYGRGFIRV